MRTLRLLTAIGPAIVLFGCLLPLQTVDVTVTLPELPRLWTDTWGEAGYHISWQAFPTVCGVVDVESGTRSVVLELPRGCVVPILAWPVWRSGGPGLQPTELLRPAGGIWFGEAVPAPEGGAHRLPPQVELTHVDGPAAYVLHRAAALGAETQTFNSERMSAEIALRLPHDPWLLDIDRVVRALCERSMRADYIREADRIHVWLEVPEGTWCGTSPYGPPLTGGLQELAMESGLTPFYDGAGRRLVVVVDEEERAWCAISPPG